MLAVATGSNAKDEKCLKFERIRPTNYDKIRLTQKEIGILIVFEGSLIFESINSPDFETSKSWHFSSKSGAIFNYVGLPTVYSISHDFDGLFIALDTDCFRSCLSHMRYGRGKELESEPLNLVQLPEKAELLRQIGSLDFYTIDASSLPDEILRLKTFELMWLVNRFTKFNFDRFAYGYLKPDRVLFDDLLQKNFRRNPTVNDLADFAGLSISTFKRKFVEIYNCSPKKVIQRMRLEYAKNLLEYSSKTISEIGYESGFENISHFIQVFRQQFGVTPKSFVQYHGRDSLSVAPLSLAS